MTHTITAAAYDGDIASRLRNWRGLHLAHSGRLFEEAADTIERARGDAAVARLRLDAANAEIERLRQFDRSQPIAICNTQRPVAWARFWPNGSPQSVYLDRPPADAVPLYRSPTTHTTPDEGSVQGQCTLTVEERVSIDAAAIAFDGEDTDLSAVLRHLLERLPTHTIHRQNDHIPAAAYKLADAILRERGNHSEKPNSSPTLTDEEREAIYRAEARLRTAYVPDDETAAILRNLLERLPCPT